MGEKQRCMEGKVIPLPSSCQTCPFYQYKDAPHNGFVPDKVIPGSEVYFLAQNPGKDEVAGKKLIRRVFTDASLSGAPPHAVTEYATVYPEPLIGATGIQFNTKFLPLAGLQREEVSLGNAIRCRPGKALGLPKEDDLPTITATMRLDNDKTKADIVKALRHCRATHMHVPPSVKVVVTMGRHAMFAMTGLAKDQDEYKKKQGVLESWRGYGVSLRNGWDYITTVDTTQYHHLLGDGDVSAKEGMVKANASNGYTVQSHQIHRSSLHNVVFFTMHPAALNYGENKKFVHATMQDFYKLGRLLKGEWPSPVPQWSTVAPATWPTYSSFDTEYNPDTAELYRWSMCDLSHNLYCVECDGSRIQPIQIQSGSTVLIQNALADIGYLSRLVDSNAVKIEDMMLAHSVLWSGEPHGLNYINSLYGTLNRYKHLSEGDPTAYSAYDAWEPMQMWRSYFIPEFKRDKQSWMVYKKYRLPLIEIIDKAQRSGAKVDTVRLSDVQLILQERLEGYKQRAREITGDDSFHLGGSKRLKEEIYG